MCAIAGSVSVNTATANGLQGLNAMLNAMKHRGPDSSGTWVNQQGGVALGHNRLSILDLSSGGHQPMINKLNGDVLVFNGEIYNFLELRKTLEELGAHFRSRSDTEVLLLALQFWGLACLDRLQGMYAFALWREVDKTLYLVRDPLGIKPLYYWVDDFRQLVFASELKAFYPLPGFVARIDGGALSQFLEFGYCFDDNKTCLRGVNKLPPGTILKYVLSDAAPQFVQYYKPRPETEIPEDQSKREERLYETLLQVVRQHLVADVPVALLLSGGLDSSILAAISAQFIPLQTISMGFAGSALDERPFARRAASWVKSAHHEVEISPADVKAGLAENVKSFDDLFSDWGTISTRLLYAKCRERGVKVVLVGEGSDELFGGYPIFRESLSREPKEWWLFKLYRQYSGRRHGLLYPQFRAKMNEHLRSCGDNRFNAIRLFETLQQLPNNYVMKVDKASMAVGVEARVPFLDRRVADIAYQTPGGSLISATSEKLLLRRMARRFNLLPPDLLERGKLGGSIASTWMDDDPTWRKYAETVILDGSGWTAKLGLSGAMRAYFIGGRSGYSFPHGLSIFRNLAWRLLILELWARAFQVAPHAL